MRARTQFFIGAYAPVALASAVATVAVLAGVAVAADRLPTGGAAFQRDLTLLVLGVAAALLVVLAVVLWMIAGRWAAPLGQLAREGRAVAQGHYDCAFVEAGSHEARAAMRNLGRIARSFDRLETARRTWLVSVSEELRRPIHALEIEIDALLARQQIPSPDEIDAIGAQVRRLGELAEDLHAVALADLGRLPVSFAAVDPTALIHNAVWTNRKRAEAKRIALEPGALPVTSPVKWDGRRIEQLFSALIEHSLRYTPAGGRIVIGLEQQRGAWRLIVDDTAPGVDVELSQRLFEPFYRTAYEPGTSVVTSGLGLATAQAIVEAHHGRIEAGRSPLGGLRIVTTLPAMPPTA